MRLTIATLAAAALLGGGIGITEAAQEQGGTGAAPEQAAPRSGQTQPNAQPNGPGDRGSTTPQEPRSGSSTPSDSLSNQLNRSGGVIQPPPSGDRGVIPPPNQGTSRTPVIPPPGSGGNSEIQPK